MAKTKISEFSATPGNNTDIDGINIAEGCAPSGINDAIRELMAQLKDFQAGTAGDSFNGPVGTSTAAAGAFTTLSASGAVTLSGGTANGVAYLNGSKVLTTGSALTFNGSSLTVDGTASGSERIQVATSGVAKLRLYDAGGTCYIDTGDGLNPLAIGTSGAQPVIFRYNGTEQMRLTSTGLGIGTSSPGAKLTVSGSGFGTGGQIQIIRTDTSSNFALAGLAGGAFQIADVTAGGATRVVLDSSGNLGLGVTPSAWNTGQTFKGFDLNSYGAMFSYTNGQYTGVANNAFFGSGGWTYKNSYYATLYHQGLSGQHQWFTAPSGTAGNAISFTQAMTLDASGNLGVGTTSASARVHAVSPNNLEATAIGLFVANNGTQSVRIGYNGIYQTAAQALLFGTNDTERARIDSSGNFFLGKTASNTTTVGFEVAPTGYARCVNAASTNGITVWDLYSTGAGAYRFYVGMGGTIYATSTSISAISDASLKENIRDLETGLPEVMALKPRRFDWKNGDAKNVAGFVAQEVEQVLPELVTDYIYNKDEDGNDIIKKSLKMGDILPTLVKAIQEQQAIINQLKADVAALKGN